MAATQGRRKHNACLLRIRENCPFRKLRKNKCYDIQNVPSQKTGEHWAHFTDQPALAVPQEDCGAAVVYSEPCPQAAFVQPTCCLHQSQEQLTFPPSSPILFPLQNTAAMDTDHLTPPEPQAGCYALPSASSSSASVPSVLSPQHQQNLSALTCDASMELDSGVDPETGERAQG
ncbi:hypothetical protein MATL_G00129500 [Megalops atlanticus]|uniref:Uncharacterized protein n=1 Tax=Megalops atlanticus TaxID=7932 RepID=A0A9D3PXG8_MEGAT|nr:hypothetical protein MATL_G00129500 [Megalops atlanticus]